MDKEPLEIKAALQIAKPVHEVFDAIVDPAKMSNYFISDSTGKMEEGKDLVWHFPEFSIQVPVRVGSIKKDRYVSFVWDGEDGRDHLVEISLEPYGDQSSVVRVTEHGGLNDEAGIKWLKGNTEGWANFLNCLKAWLEYGINLRKGAFDFQADNRVGGKGLFPFPSSHTTVRAVRHTAVCQNNDSCDSVFP
jgi:uncharacterized protein YndB with AHSA1/START domain